MTSGPAGPPPVEDLIRQVAPGVLGALVARYGQFDACEDAVQEALADAVVQWPRDGVPDNPRGWLMTVARRCLVDAWRSDGARRRREHAGALLNLPVTAPDGSATVDDAPQGLRLTYQPGTRTVLAEANPSAIMCETGCPRPTVDRTYMFAIRQLLRLA